MRLKSTTKTSEVTLIYLNPLKQIKKLKFLAQSLSDTIINVKYFKKKTLLYMLEVPAQLLFHHWQHPHDKYLIQVLLHKVQVQVQVTLQERMCCFLNCVDFNAVFDIISAILLQ